MCGCAHMGSFDIQKHRNQVCIPVSVPTFLHVQRSSSRGHSLAPLGPLGEGAHGTDGGVEVAVLDVGAVFGVTCGSMDGNTRNTVQPSSGGVTWPCVKTYSVWTGSTSTRHV